MYKTIKIGLIIILISTTTIHCTATTQPVLSQKNICYGLVAAVTTLCVGKVAYTAYLDYLWPTSRLIKHYKTLFKKMNNAIDRYNNLYMPATTMDDSQLTEYIYATHTIKYPFLTYHSQLQTVLYELNSYLHEIQQSLKRIIYRQKHISAYLSPENQTMLRNLTHLTTYAMRLNKKIKHTVSLITPLKERIYSSSHYHDDYEDQNEEQPTIDNNYSTIEETKEIVDNDNQCEQEPITDTFDRIEKEIIQFNMDYY